MILKNHSKSNITCWSGNYILSFSWWSLFKTKIGYMERSWLLTWEVNSKSWSKNYYYSRQWRNNI